MCAIGPSVSYWEAAWPASEIIGQVVVSAQPHTSSVAQASNIASFFV